MVFTVFKVFQSICTFAIFFSDTHAVFGVALLRLPNFCIFVSGCFQYLPGTFEFTLSGIFNYDTICLVAFLTIGTSIGFFALLFGVFASFFAGIRFQIFIAPFENLRGAIWGRPWHPSYTCTHTSSNKSILLPM
jgi:hypothetical protein